MRVWKVCLPFVHIDMPLSIINESMAIMMPSRARKTQSSPRRASVCFQTHDEMRFIRVARLPSSSCKYFPALLLYKPMRSTLSYSTICYYCTYDICMNCTYDRRQQHTKLAAMPSVSYKMASKCGEYSLSVVEWIAFDVERIFCLNFNSFSLP